MQCYVLCGEDYVLFMMRRPGILEKMVSIIKQGDVAAMPEAAICVGNIAQASEQFLKMVIYNLEFVILVILAFFH